MKKILLIIAMTAAMFASTVEDNINAPLVALKKYQTAEVAGDAKTLSALSSQYRLHLPYSPIFTKNKPTTAKKPQIITIDEAVAIDISTLGQSDQKVVMVNENGGWKVHAVIPADWLIGQNTITPIFPKIMK